MRFAIPVLLLSLVLPVAARAEINPETEAAYENAVHLNGKFKGKLARLVEWVPNGMPDKQAAAWLAQRMENKFVPFLVNATRARPVKVSRPQKQITEGI